MLTLVFTTNTYSFYLLKIQIIRFLLNFGKSVQYSLIVGEFSLVTSLFKVPSWMQDLAAATDEEDATKYVDAVNEFDSMTLLVC